MYSTIVRGMQKFKRKLGPYITNLGGWTTDRKIIVIESDDWGSIRMPSKQVFNKCLKAGYRVDRIAYEKYDSLASENDLELLFELLSGFKDFNGNHPVITANSLVANPDFGKIEASGFKEYHYEPITETFKRYPEHGRCFNLWKEGLEQKLFYPQSHGREHLNVSMFMNALRRGDRDAIFGFKHGIPGSIPRGVKGGNRYVETLNYSSVEDKEEKLEIILEGLDLFEELFGYRSDSFIPPNYLWSSDYDEKMNRYGVKYYQGNRKMKEPIPQGGVKLHPRTLGERNKYGQIYLVRNVLFEPSLFKNGIDDPVERCLKQVQAAFRMNKPAVICSHRINYVGYLDPKNRDRSLKMLQEVLEGILKTWPEVEFMTSVHIGRLITGEDD
ncbi:hypothetical protein [Rhodohalobacter barkolensis]|uniref:Polysaccharide (De)acetylase n=1 Tax=Rhodohalobacter barkolensis TaxID=2053187 RepID=A0A2N0VGE7_9BACT|nr:hypothetical protein [Rhodohalobacter barkolensis]PKD43261.1 hypothetical protein CWD77_11645 [Rhodohalobacter barkolensis]